MNAQKLMILSILLLIIGAAISSKIGTGPEEIITKSESDILLQEVRYIASNAVIYWRKPAQLGGGKKSFIGITDVRPLRIPTTKTAFLTTSPPKKLQPLRAAKYDRPMCPQQEKQS